MDISLDKAYGMVYLEQYKQTLCHSLLELAKDNTVLCEMALPVMISSYIGIHIYTIGLCLTYYM